MEKIVIEERQSIAIKIAFIAFVMLIASITVWGFGIKDNKILLWILGFLATIILSISFIVFLGRAIQRKPLLTITFDGIIDSSSSNSVGYIAFQDIEGFCVVNIYGKKVIGVIPKDEEAFIDKLSPIRQGVARSNVKLKYPPFSIWVDRAKDMSLEDILTLLKKRLHDYSCLYD